MTDEHKPPVKSAPGAQLNLCYPFVETLLYHSWFLWWQQRSNLRAVFDVIAKLLTQRCPCLKMDEAKLVELERLSHCFRFMFCVLTSLVSSSGKLSWYLVGLLLFFLWLKLSRFIHRSLWPPKCCQSQFILVSCTQSSGGSDLINGTKRLHLTSVNQLLIGAFKIKAKLQVLGLKKPLKAP